MEGTSNGFTSQPEGVVPEEVQFVLDWNPPQLREADPNLPPNTARTTSIGYSRPAAFYDRHLASHLILERVSSVLDYTCVRHGKHGGSGHSRCSL